MTPKARARHIESLKQVLLDAGLKQDSYGNFKHPDTDEFRIKFKKVNFRCERKIYKQWKLIAGDVLSKTTAEQMAVIAKSITPRKSLPKKKFVCPKCGGSLNCTQTKDWGIDEDTGELDCPTIDNFFFCSDCDNEDFGELTREIIKINLENNKL